MAEIRIDEADENTIGERTWGVTTASGYIVVTESLHSKTLRSEVLNGTASTAELEGAKILVERRRQRDGLIARVEVCDELWRTLVRIEADAPPGRESDYKLDAVAYMKDVVEADRSAAQATLVSMPKG